MKTRWIWLGAMLAAGCDCSPLNLDGLKFKCAAPGDCDGGPVGVGGGGGASSGGGPTGGGVAGGGAATGGGGTSAGGGTSGGGGGSMAGGGGAGGGSGGGGTSDAGQPRALCVQFALAGCARQIACGLADPAALTQCTLTASWRCESTFAGLEDSLVVVDGGDGCLRSLSSTPCHAFGPAAPDPWPDLFFTPACNGAFVTALEGVDAGCNPYLFALCESHTCNPGAGSYVCGHCAPPGQLNDRCDNVPCAPQLYCQSDAGTVPLCQATKPDGQPCASRDECLSNACTQPPDGGTASCGVLPHGATCLFFACGPDDYCRGQLVQISNIPLDAGTCQARLPLGASCANEQFDDGCVDGGTCLGGQCTLAYGTQDVGQECTVTAECKDTLFCTQGETRQFFTGGQPNTARGTCEPRGGTGTSCASAPCLLTHYCDGSQTCRPLGGAGSTDCHCLDWLACPGGAGSCQPLSLPGESCAGHTCLVSRCIDDAGMPSGNGVCAGFGAPGEACVDGTHCASAQCSTTGSPGACLPSCR